MANTTWSVVSGFQDEDEAETRKGPWTVEEDLHLTRYIGLHGEGRWSFLAKAAGLKRTGRSCRLRWFNSLRPGLKHGKITPDEELLIIELHRRWGNRWSHIARRLPGRTDNEIKNYWRTRIKGKLNLQVESGSGGMEVDKRVHFDRSLGYDCLPTSSHRPPDHDGAEPSTSFQTQSTEKAAVQMNKTRYLQGNISHQVNPIDEVNDEYVLPGESGRVPSPIDDDWQPSAASRRDLKDSENELFEDSIAYNFSVGSLGSLLYSSELFCADGAAEGGINSPSSWYMVASPEAFSDSEAYMNRYSDVLWNM